MAAQQAADRIVYGRRATPYEALSSPLRPADRTEFDGGVGYLLKDRVSDLAVFATELRNVAAGGTALDPDLVVRLVARRREDDPLGRLTDGNAPSSP
jgi:hypothetical protein